MTNYRALTMTSTLEAPVTPPPIADKNSAWLLELIALLARLGGQVFLTTTHPELLRIVEDRVDHVVAAGAVRRA